MANKEPRFCAFSDVGKPPRPQRFLPPFRSSNSPGNTRGATVGKAPVQKPVFFSLPHVRKPVPCLTWPGKCLPPSRSNAFPSLAGAALAAGCGESLAPAACGVPSLSAPHTVPDSFPARQTLRPRARVNSPRLHPRCTRHVIPRFQGPLPFPLLLPQGPAHRAPCPNGARILPFPEVPAQKLILCDAEQGLQLCVQHPMSQ